MWSEERHLGRWAQFSVQRKCLSLEGGNEEEADVGTGFPL